MAFEPMKLRGSTTDGQDPPAAVPTTPKRSAPTPTHTTQQPKPQVGHAASAPSPAPAVKPPPSPSSAAVDLSELEKLIHWAHRVVTRFPHASHIPAARIQSWIDSTLAIDAKRLQWHLIRASGFGGSDIGPLLAEASGKSDAFTTAREIVSSKLLLVPPTPGDRHTRRGITHEPVVRQRLMARLKNATQDTAALQALRKAAQSPSKPWVRYSADDVLLINGKRFLVDYKCPSKLISSDEIATGYATQLHLGKVALEDRNLKVDGLLLVQFVGAPELQQLQFENGEWTSRVSFEDYELVPSIVPFDAGMNARMLEAGDYYWHDYTMKGELPPWPRQENYQLDENMDAEAVSKLRGLAEEFTRMKFIGDQFADRAKELSAQIKAICQQEGQYIGHRSLVLPGVKASATPEIDDVRLREVLGGQGMTEVLSRGKPNLDLALKLLDQHGIDPMLACPLEVNTDLAIQALNERGIPLSRVADEAITLRLDKTKNSVLTERLPDLTEIFTKAKEELEDIRLYEPELPSAPIVATTPKP